MFFRKLFTIFLAFTVLTAAACGLWESEESANSGEPPISGQVETGIPFENKEPETFQTDIVVTNYANGEKSEKRYFLARDKNKSLLVFDRETEGGRSVLRLCGETFFINDRDKTFSKTEIAPAGVENSDEMREFLTVSWLSRKTFAVFEKLGTENDLTRFRVRFEDAPLSEIILTYDEKLKLPVRQEFYSIGGEQKTLTMSVELKNFQPSADEKYFVLPQGYKKSDTR